MERIGLYIEMINILKYHEIVPVYKWYIIVLLLDNGVFSEYLYGRSRQSAVF